MKVQHSFLGTVPMKAAFVCSALCLLAVVAADSKTTHTRTASPEALTKLEVITETAGDGKLFPKAGDKLTMHYTGTLKSNGKKFDSSLDRNQPFKFTIGESQVIQGWDEGILKMSLGEKAKLEIPASMGYGSRGAGGVIPPNADLVFDVQLLGINDKMMA